MKKWGHEGGSRRRPPEDASFTLIELLIAMGVAVLILGAVYFSLTSALESWHYTRDELALQEVMSQVLEGILDGSDFSPGLRSAIEVTRADDHEISFVLPWDEEFPASSQLNMIQLAQYIEPGAGLPVAELFFPETRTRKPLPVSFDNPDDLTAHPRIKLGFQPLAGTTLRISYHPDPKRVPESIVTFRYNPQTRTVSQDQVSGIEELGKNSYGVAITDCTFRCYDLLNNLVVESGDVPPTDLPQVGAVEVKLTGTLGDHSLTLWGMVMLRNSSRHSGLLILRPGMHVPIVDSRTIKTFSLTNLVGVSHDDEIQLEVHPKTGKIWRVTIHFERYGQARAVIGQITVEYPPGNTIYTDRPRTNVDSGLDFLSLGPGGLYDYDDDPDMNDVVLVEGDPVILTVTKMDVKGAACFIQP